MISKKGEKRRVRADNLSGGMKRKLSLGVAVCGDSKHLILDEPSSGIDVTARRELWTILEKYRYGRGRSLRSKSPMRF